MYSISLKDCDGEEIYSCDLDISNKNVEEIMDEVIEEYAESQRDEGYYVEFHSRKGDSGTYNITLTNEDRDEVYEATNFDITDKTVADITNEMIELYVESLKEDTYSIEFTKMKE